MSPIQSPFTHTSVLLPLTTYPVSHWRAMLEPCVRLPEKTPAGTVGKAVQSERSSKQVNK